MRTLFSPPPTNCANEDLPCCTTGARSRGAKRSLGFNRKRARSSGSRSRPRCTIDPITMRREAGEPQPMAPDDAGWERSLRRHGAAEVLVVGAVGPGQDEGRSGVEIEDLVTGVEDDTAGAGSLHDVDRTVQRHSAADEVVLCDEVVVLMQREAGGAIHVVRAVHDVLDRS